jgi:uroporphyrinogen III methyltransferase/synthase
VKENAQNFRGRVCLVGAGPGDAGLITVRGLALLRAADVVVHDALILPDLLAEAREDAQVINVGKRHADHTLSQGEINELLVAKAHEGKRVVRLKGGDPYVFGRGGEEASHVAAAGIPLEVVPGVTAGIAAPALAGIPVTHRQHSSSVTFITGHEGEGNDRPRLDYAALAQLLDAGGTLCIYMGMARLPEITAALSAALKRKDVPAAVVQWGGSPRQRSVFAPLTDLPQAVEMAGVCAPAVIVIGAVAGLGETSGETNKAGPRPSGLSTYANRPLFGQRVLITRPRSQAADLRHRLAELGAEVLEAPTIRIADPSADELAKVDDALRNLSRYDWLVLTSANGVEALARRVEALKLDARAFAPVKLAAIGSATAAALWQHLRLTADLVPETFVAESLAAALLERGNDVGKMSRTSKASGACGASGASGASGNCGTSGTSGGRGCLLLRADIARAALPDLLRQAGRRVDDLMIYRTLPADSLPPAVLTALRNRQVEWVTFTSSSTARNMVTLLGDERELLRQVKIASIGPVTSRTLRELGFEPAVEAVPSDVSGLVQALQAPDGGAPRTSTDPTCDAHARHVPLAHSPDTPADPTPPPA